MKEKRASTKYARAYKKVLKKILNEQVRFKGSLLEYILTFLNFLQDSLVAQEIKSARHQKKYVELENITFSELTNVLTNTLEAFDNYEITFEQYNQIKEKLVEDPTNEELQKMLVKLGDESMQHWSNFWEYLITNIWEIEELASDKI